MTPEIPASRGADPGRRTDPARGADPVRGADPTGAADPGSRHRRRLALLADVVLAPAVYLVLTAAGVTLPVALAVSLAAGAGWALRGLARRERPGVLPVLVLLTLALGGGLALAGGDPAFAVAKDSLVTGMIGLVLLGSLATARPLMTVLIRPFVTDGDTPADRARWESLLGWPPFARSLRTATAVWGTGLLVEAAARVAVVAGAPLPFATAASPLLTVACVVVLAVWTRHHCRPAHEQARTRIPAPHP